MNDESKKELLNNEIKTANDSQISMSNNLTPLKRDSKAREMAEYAEKAKAAVEIVEQERDEYRSLYVSANSEILELKSEIRHLRDQVANRQAQNLRETTMERERMNIQMQKQANEKEFEALLNGSFQNLLEKRKK